MNKRGKYAPKAASSYPESTRRRKGCPITSELTHTDDEVEFLRAMERYQRENRRPFPTYSEVLEVLRALGYRRVAEPGPSPRRR